MGHGQWTLCLDISLLAMFLWGTGIALEIFFGYFSGNCFRVFFLYSFCFCLLLFAFCFCFCFCCCFCFLLFASFCCCFCTCLCFLHFLLLLLLLFASAFASADYLLCIDTATKLDDKTFTLSFDTQLITPIKKRSSPELSIFDLNCGGGAAPSPAPPPALLIVPTTVHHPYYFQYLHHLDHPATSLTTVTTTTIFFALTLPQGGFLLCMAQGNPKPLKENRKEDQRSPYYSSSLLFPHSYFSFVKWDAFSGRSLKKP